MIHNWLRFITRKLIELLASLVTLAALSFLLLRLLPGGPFDEEAALNPIVKESLTKQWGLDHGFFYQLGSYLASAFRGNFGRSMVRPEQTVAEIIGSGTASSLSLGFITLLVVIIGAFAITLVAVRYKGTTIESLIDQAVISMLSLPSLFWGPLLIYLFGFYFNLLPIALLSSPRYYILPVLTLALRPLAGLVRILKKSMIDNLKQDYARTAVAKGLSAWGVLTHHVLRNSLIPFLSYLGPMTTYLLSGSFLVEMLFAIPGLGTEFISALNNRDYTLILGLTLFYGAMLITINTLIDVIMRAIDPRLKEETA